MQALVYFFVVVVALALGAGAFFGLGFTPIESVLISAVIFFACLVLMEKRQRRQTVARIDRAMDDLSRLMSADAQAGHNLSQRVNALAGIDAGPRLDVLEADVSVLGTVVRQLAEAMTEIETAQAKAASAPKPAKKVEPIAPESPKKSAAKIAATDPKLVEPVIPLETLRQAISDDRLVFNMQPIITLPQRRTHGYDLVPRLMMEDGDMADAPDFMPRRGGDDLVRQMERRGLDEAVTIVRRARMTGQPATLFVPMSRTTLADKQASDGLIELLDANRAVTQSVVLNVSEADWRILGPVARGAISELFTMGVHFSLTGTQTLRLDFNELAGMGVTSVRTSAKNFIDAPEKLSDFHAADLSDYVGRYGIDLVIEDIESEQQILHVLEDGVRLALGSYIAKPSAVRPDLLVRRDRSIPQPVQRVSGA